MQRSALRAREQLVRHNLGLVAHTWSRHRCSLPAHDDTTADALQEAALNLVQAAEKCPSRCIHPGKPLNPNESNLEELVARAAPFNS